MSYEIIGEIASGTGPVALATVIAVQGSSPRHLGTMMLIKPDGTTLGTVGGGKIEWEALAAAKRSIAQGLSFGIDVEMIGTETTGAAPICGGRVRLSIESVTDRTLYAAARDRLAGGSSVILASDTIDSGCSRPGGLLLAVLKGDGSPIAGEIPAACRDAVLGLAIAANGFLVSANGMAYGFIKPAEDLFMFGGGHIGRAVVRCAVELDFRVTVVDERPDYAHPERFPAKAAVLCGDYSSVIGGLSFGDSTYVVIATPGHTTDLSCVRAIMGRGYRYAGFVGSKRKTRMLLDRLAEDGFDRAEIDALRAPVGIDIAAETPAEIALSILAEVIAARRGAPALAAMDADRIRRRS